jgi:retinol dehydrogenase 12
LSRIVYLRNAVVYIAGRSSDKAREAIAKIKARHPQSNGRIEFLQLDLSDLDSIKASADEFKGKEKRLDYLVNNAGVLTPPAGSVTVQVRGVDGPTGFLAGTDYPQNHEMQIGTNCLGPFLFTNLLTPLLQSTAEHSPPNSVRVAWSGSLNIDLDSPKGGVVFDGNGGVSVLKSMKQYSQSKAGNYFLANAYGQRNSAIVSTVCLYPSSFGCSGLFLTLFTIPIVLQCFNPGNIRSDLQRHMSAFERFILVSRYLFGAALLANLSSPLQNTLFLYPAVYGAYTELYCGFSHELTTSDNGRYVST